ncbi:fringe glycosyltransferase-like [Oratosquilla oratoria]|uniref:fringe glycosyltransferase-like n=1 Tax=Oratosquilla oratoria TaxID=337810 RepID=UPI003F7757B1
MWSSERTMRLRLKNVVGGAVVVCGIVSVVMLVVGQLNSGGNGGRGEVLAAAAEAGFGASGYRSVRGGSGLDVGLAGGWERGPRSLAYDGSDNLITFDGRNTLEDTNLGLEEDVDGDKGGTHYSDERYRGLINTLVATATAKSPTALDDVFISVKTTKSFHKTRLDLILKTWFNLARHQTWFFTDTDDEEYQQKTGGHMVNTNCSSSHNRRALCCKMAREFDAFLESGKRWFCHFDDDNYVNVPQLVATLGNYDPHEDWYLGKPSIRAPLEIINRENISQRISFWFATGGAGFCISRSLALKMMPIASGGKFISLGEKIRLPDDVTMGYLIEHVLRKKLTVVEEFHSHLEPMRFVNTDTLAEQISLSYSQYGNEMNVLPIEGLDARFDPTRVLSLHCHLYPNFSFCPER